MSRKEALAQFKPLIGELIFRAFFDDEEFREVMKPLNGALERLLPLDVKNPISFGLNAVNSYLVTSYHATRAIELVSQAVRERFREDFGITDLMIIQHGHLLEAIVNLHCAQTFFQLEPIKKTLSEAVVKSIDAVFAANFPRLRDARNALAHQDERMLAIVDGVCKIEKFDILEAIGKMQFISLSGAKLTVKDKSTADFVFEFPSRLIQETAKEVGGVLSKST